LAISTAQLLILTIIAGIGAFQNRVFGAPQINRPIVLGPVVGAVLGDLEMGLTIGASLEMIWMGVSRIGGSVPPNITIGSVLGTSMAIIAGTNVEGALAIAVPAALVGSSIEILNKTACTFFFHKAENYAEKANLGGISLMVHLGNFLYFLMGAVPVFLALFFGAEYVEAIFAATPEAVMNSLEVAGGILPALGFGVLLHTLASVPLLPYFFAGFLLSSYLEVPVIGIALLGVTFILIRELSGFNSPNEEAGV
jgi:mannose/fructose/N-acetylgalactosamine-specific phosphotransferase system component IIC